MYPWRSTTDNSQQYRGQLGPGGREIWPRGCGGNVWAILSLDFVQEQKAMIDLAAKTLYLRHRDQNLPLSDLLPRPVYECSEMPVSVTRTVEIPPQSEMEIMASIQALVEGFCRKLLTSVCRLL